MSSRGEIFTESLASKLDDFEKCVASVHRSLKKSEALLSDDRESANEVLKTPTPGRNRQGRVPLSAISLNTVVSAQASSPIKPDSENLNPHKVRRTRISHGRATAPRATEDSKWKKMYFEECKAHEEQKRQLLVDLARERELWVNLLATKHRARQLQEACKSQLNGTMAPNPPSTKLTPKHQGSETAAAEVGSTESTSDSDQPTVSATTAPRNFNGDCGGIEHEEQAGSPAPEVRARLSDSSERPPKLDVLGKEAAISSSAVEEDSPYLQQPEQQQPQQQLPSVTEETMTAARSDNSSSSSSSSSRLDQNAVHWKHVARFSTMLGNHETEQKRKKTVPRHQSASSSTNHWKQVVRFSDMLEDQPES